MDRSPSHHPAAVSGETINTASLDSDDDEIDSDFESDEIASSSSSGSSIGEIGSEEEDNINYDKLLRGDIDEDDDGEEEDRPTSVELKNNYDYDEGDVDDYDNSKEYCVI